MSYNDGFLNYVNSNDDNIEDNKINRDYISWNEFFMGVAELAAKRSKDPICKVGAVIVNENNHIISTGYNGFPNTKSDLLNNDTLYPWEKNNDDPLANKFMYVVHAELNAILNAERSVKNCTLYVSLFPCNECAKAIVQSGIKKIIYKSKDNKPMYDVSTKIFKNAGIEIIKY